MIHVRFNVLVSCREKILQPRIKTWCFLKKKKKINISPFILNCLVWGSEVKWTEVEPAGWSGSERLEELVIVGR